jgi:hypothetical protein
LSGIARMRAYFKFKLLRFFGLPIPEKTQQFKPTSAEGARKGENA